MSWSLPLVGFVGPSGSGKTTLLERIGALLTDAGVRLAMLKHARPGFDIDPDPGKDSYRLRSAGASQVLIASRDRWAMLGEQDDPLREPSLEAMLRRLDSSSLDGVLVEGFGHEQYPKIEVYRPSHSPAPQYWPQDRSVIAVASDVPMETGATIWLDLNDPTAAARFVARQLGLPYPAGSEDRVQEGLAWE